MEHGKTTSENATVIELQQPCQKEDNILLNKYNLKENLKGNHSNLSL